MRIRLLIILALLNPNVFAVEGMWEPSQMGNLKKELKNTGYSREMCPSLFHLLLKV